MKLLSYIYLFITNIRNFFYDINAIKLYKSDSYVISIGNIIAGGTGKTPIIIHIAELLKLEGYKVGIITGGYRRKSKGLLVVHDVDKLSTTVDKAGDEAFLIAEKLGVPLLIHDKKYKVLKELDSLFDVDIVLIDDGFQHRKIYRDLDIVLINDKTIQENNLIPAGLLREKKSNISRADLLLYRDLETTLSEYNKLDKFHFKSNINTTNITKGNSVVITAIANPSNFVKFLEENDASIEKVFRFKDHHFFTESEIKSIISYCNSNNIKTVYTTEKDYVKLKTYSSLFNTNNIALISIELEIKFDNPNEFKNHIIGKINEKSN